MASAMRAFLWWHLLLTWVLLIPMLLKINGKCLLSAISDSGYAQRAIVRSDRYGMLFSYHCFLSLCEWPSRYLVQCRSPSLCHWLVASFVCSLSTVLWRQTADLGPAEPISNSSDLGVCHKENGCRTSAVQLLRCYLLVAMRALLRIFGLRSLKGPHSIWQKWSLITHSTQFQPQK